jgi:hypothetical protein
MTTEYEKERLKNIERNKALLSGLGIDKGLIQNQPKTPNNRAPKRKAKSEDLHTIKRESRRLAQKDRPSYNYDEIHRQQKEISRIIAKEEQKTKKELKRKKSEVYTNMWRTPSKRWSRNSEQEASDGETSSDDDDTDSPSKRRKSMRLNHKVKYFTTF